MLLQIGWLLTVANLGDSRAVLDTGVGEAVMLTVDHRVATYQGERRRVEAMGNTIAPIDFSGSGGCGAAGHAGGVFAGWHGGWLAGRLLWQPLSAAGSGWLSACRPHCQSCTALIWT
jgi:BRCA1-associated protein